MLWLLAAFGGEPEESVEIGVLMGTVDGAFADLVVAERPVGFTHDNGEVVVDHDRDADTLTVENGKPYPITWGCELARAQHVRQEPAPGFLEVVPPGGTHVVRFVRKGVGKKTYSYHWAWEQGDHRAASHDVVYQLPWASNQSFEVLQTWSGSYSHKRDHAIDVEMPIGTPVLAARDGVVVSIRDGWGEGGPSRDFYEQANHIVVQHDDGSYASYSHLQGGAMEVAIGDVVQTGQPLGRSGNSGWSTGPHLHFVVKTALDAWVPRTLPVRFDVDGQVLMLTSGKAYP